jgi:uncharacterized protein (DUF1501 family)
MALTSEALAAHAARAGSRASRATTDSMILKQLAESRARTAKLISSGLDKKFAFLSGTDAFSKAIQTQYQFSSGSNETSADVLAAFAAQTLKSNLAQFVSLKFAGNFVDGHASTNPGHLSGLYPCIAALANLIDDLGNTPAPDSLAGTLLDNTTIVVFSEFSRDPTFNKYTGVGRDHHFSNSCLLIGAGIKGPSVIGATTRIGGMQPSVVDFQDGCKVLPDSAKPNGNQRYITPDDIGATLLASAGLDHSEYRSGLPLWPILTARPT